MEEAPKASLLFEPKPPVDVGLWGPFKVLDRAMPATYDLLRPSQQALGAAKQEFVNSGYVVNPDLRPTRVGSEELDTYQTKLLAFKKLAKEYQQPKPLIAQAYRWRVNEMIANSRMVQAGISGDQRRFEAYNTFIYGEPDPEIFAAVTDWFRAFAQTLANDANPAISEAANQVLALVPDMGGDLSLLVPDPEVFELVRQRHFREGGYYALILAGVNIPPEVKKINSDLGDPILEQVLENLESNYKLGDAPSTTWDIDNYSELVRRPIGYDLPVARFIGLPVGHEIGAHLLERINGLRQPLRLAGSGLDRFENGNEGRAVIREQVAYPNFDEFSRILRWQDIMRRHLAISLARGLSGQRMGLREVYPIINAVDKLWERNKRPEDTPGADTKAENRSLALLTERIFRGTDGQFGPYLKDKVYLEGNVACWRLAKEHPELIEQGDFGKFDITNPRHIALAQTTGILPKS